MGELVALVRDHRRENDPDFVEGTSRPSDLVISVTAEEWARRGKR
jgi:hypothetical protein